MPDLAERIVEAVMRVFIAPGPWSIEERDAACIAVRHVLAGEVRPEIGKSVPDRGLAERIVEALASADMLARTYTDEEIREVVRRVLAETPDRYSEGFRAGLRLANTAVAVHKPKCGRAGCPQDYLEAIAREAETEAGRGE